MKQVSIAKNSLILSSPFHRSICQKRLFSKSRLVPLLAGFALLLGSCQKEELRGNSQKQDLLTNWQKQNQEKKAVPFKAEFITTEEIVREPQPGVPLLNHITGTGHGSHIGKATFDAIVEADVFAPGPVIASGKFIIIAANGDKIFLTTTGMVEGPDANGNFKVTLNGTITGGTGRFAGATGTLTGIATDSETNPAGTTSFNGTISY